MAIDSAAKRRSAAVVAMVWMAPGITPNATKPVAWRQSVGWGYQGIDASTTTTRQTVLDRAMRPLASNLLGVFGKNVTITYHTPGSYSAVTGTSTSTTSTATVRAMVERYDIREFGEFVRAGDLKVTTYARGVTTPDVNDRVTIDLVSYRVISVESLYSGEQPALHIMQVRR